MKRSPLMTTMLWAIITASSVVIVMRVLGFEVSSSVVGGIAGAVATALTGATINRGRGKGRAE